MLRKLFRWAARHWKLSAFLAFAFLIIAVNGVAFNHAHAMTHFTQSGGKTLNPELLSFGQKLQVCLLGVNIPRPENSSTSQSLGLAFETRRFRGIDDYYLEGWYIPRAREKGLVLLTHGYASCKANPLPEAKALYDLGYATFLLDFRGSGGSDGNETTLGLYEANDVASAVDFLRTTFPKNSLILYGQSMGSVAILRAIALNDLKPEAVILECPFDNLLATVSNRFSAMGLPAIPFAQLLVFWGGKQHGFNGFYHNPAEYAKQVRCPALHLHGEKDLRVTQEQAKSIFSKLPGRKRFQLFADAGHESYVRGNADLWKRVVAEFLFENLSASATLKEKK